jgi:ABC-2 type transport system ATP-binding protein
VATGQRRDHGRVIEIDDVTKRYGEKVAVDGLSFSVKPGVVTGFLGPNGAGKSTLMRIIVGLDAPTHGRATVNGTAYRDFGAPLHEVGALLEARAVHTGRSAFNHLLAMAQTHGIPRRRVSEVVELVGLQDVARKRAGGFSLGMGQRLGIASALLGDPGVVILDEPSNGLDPEGIRWIRALLKDLAREGRTVFLSSHLMSEMALTADQVVVIGRGRLIADMSIAEIVARASAGSAVHVRTPQDAELHAALSRLPAVQIRGKVPGSFDVDGLSSEQIGEIAAREGIVLHELTPHQASLEDAYMALTGESVEFHAAALAATPDPELEHVA